MNPQRHLPAVPALALCLVLVSLSLRTVMASVPPLLDSVEADLHLSHTALGALTTLPVLCMGLFAPSAQWLAARVGSVGAVQLATLALAAGLGLRAVGGQAWTLYAGTLAAGVGIAIAGTLLPPLVKELFPPERAGLVTGVYMLAMMGGASVASALAVPLEGWLGSWEASLLSWVLPAVVGVLAWLPVTRGARRHRAAGPLGVTTTRLPWGSVTVWLIAAYMTIQSWAFYSSLAWLAPTYVARGWEAAQAGYLLSVFTATQFVSGLVVPALSDRMPDRRLLLVAGSVVGLVGQVGLWLLPDLAPWVWAAVVGLGQGGAFALGVLLMVDYADSPAASARIAGMVFLFSYSLSSVGPATMGAVRDVTGGFSTVWLVLTVVMVGQLVVSFALHPDRPKVD